LKELNKMEKKDIEILRALYMGNHLNGEELERAVKLVFSLGIEIKARKI